MTCFALPNGLKAPRLGIAASAKMGNAVARNRAKRLARELFRAHTPTKPVDVVFVPRREMVHGRLAGSRGRLLCRSPAHCQTLRKGRPKKEYGTFFRQNPSKKVP
jgi:RNase P protein component